MPIRNSTPTHWTPKGLTDARDGTNSFGGAMKQLVNLIPDPTTPGLYLCRPAAERLNSFAGGGSPVLTGPVSGILTVGDLEYGMVPSARNGGHDEPFCYDLANNVFLTIAGITAANTPASPPPSGDWTPPIIEQVASRVIVCHPGFPGGTTKFGWFDVSGFSEVTLGNTHTSTLIDGNPSILGAQPGMTVSGTGVSADTSVVSTAEFVLTTSAVLGGNILSVIDDSTGIAVGQDVAGLGIPGGTTVTAVVPTTIVTTGDTHTSTLLDDLDPAPGTPRFGDTISGAGIPAATTVSAVLPLSFTMVCTLNSTTTIGTQALGSLAAKQFVSGPGIPAATKVVSAVAFDLDTTGDITAGSAVIINLASTTGVIAGQAITGFGITGGAVVASVDSPTQVTASLQCTQTIVASAIHFAGATVVLNNAATITASFVTLTFQSLSVVMSQAAIATASGVAITFTSISVGLSALSLLPGDQRINVTFSGATITLNQATVATANGVSLTIAGGTRTAPLWGAGDCDRNPLLSVPLGVAQFNGRAYFADGLDGIPFSDSGFPCRRSNQPNVQALTTDDGLSVTAIGPLMLSSPISGGIVQSLIAFEGDGVMRQITGDMVTGDLRMNIMPVVTGTLAPLSVFPTGILGTAFISPQGLRFVRLDGSVTDPVGLDGEGIVDPFLYAVTPSRICAEANVAVLRISVQNGSKAGNPLEEYWFDLSRKTFSGPHSFPARLIQHWRTSFVMVPAEFPTGLWRSDAYQTAASQFTENDSPLYWVEETVLLPDNQQMAMNAMVEANLTLAAAPGDNVAVAVLDEDELLLDGVVLNPTDTLRERKLSWTKPIIFKQMSQRSSGFSNADVRVGNLYMRYEILGYNNDDSSDENFLLANDGMTILTGNANQPLAPG